MNKNAELKGVPELNLLQRHRLERWRFPSLLSHFPFEVWVSLAIILHSLRRFCLKIALYHILKFLVANFNNLALSRVCG